MKSKTWFLNKAFLYNDFRRYNWVAVAYTLALFFVVPLNIIMMLGNQYIVDKSIYKNIFLLQGQQLQWILIWTVPVGLAMLLFRYLHVRIAADALHSLPVKRSSIYRSHILAGLVLLILPVLITGIISIILHLVLDLGSYYSINDVLRWMGITTLINLTIFFTCVFVGMLVGISTVQGVLTYILLLFPMGITVLVTYNLGLLVYGFKFDLGHQLAQLSPITRVVEGFDPLYERSMGGVEILAYLAICLFLYLLANYLYKIRNLEAATQSIAFHKMHSVFKYGVTFCTMLLGGAYFHATQQSVGWTIFGYVTGSLAGYIIAQIVLQKSLGFFKEAKSFKGYAVFGAAVIILMLVIRLDLMGYEKRMPELEAVQQVYFSDNFYRYDGTGENNRTGFFSDPGNLLQIHRLHQSVIADKKRNFGGGNHNQGRNAVFIYHLSNGSTMARSYRINYDDYAGYLKQVYESKEYKEMYYDILHVNPTDVDKITLRPEMRTGNYKEAVILDPEEIKEAVEIMKRDVMRATYEQMTGQKEPWADVSLLIANDKVDNYPKLLAALSKNPPRHDGEIEMKIRTAWQKYDYLLENWLQEKGYAEKARILPEQISFAVVERVTSREQWEEMRRWGFTATRENQGGERAKRFKITDKNQIETCLREYRSLWVLNESFTPGTKDNERYVIQFYGEEQEHLQDGCFIGDQAPDFIKAYFTE